VAAPAARLLVIEEAAAHIDEGVGAPLGAAAGGLALEVTGGGEAEGGGDDGATFGVEAAGQLAATVEDAGQVQRPHGQRRFGVVAQHGVGTIDLPRHARQRTSVRIIDQIEFGQSQAEESPNTGQSPAGSGAHRISAGSDGREWRPVPSAGVGQHPDSVVREAAEAEADPLDDVQIPQSGV
jgi:hypothetical protein